MTARMMSIGVEVEVWDGVGDFFDSDIEQF